MRLFRALSWREVTRSEYQAAFGEFGGSIELHPAAIDLLEATTSHRARYFGLMRGGTLHAAIPLWRGKFKAVRNLALVSQLSPSIDLGQSELIIPIRANERIFFPFRAQEISNVHAANILNAAQSAGEAFMLAKSHVVGPDRHSGKFLQKQRAQYRRFCDAGGRYQGLQELSAEDVAKIYRELFRMRWNRDPLGSASLVGTLSALWELIGGGVLWYKSRAIAIEYFYKHSTPMGMLAVGVNGGLDPEFKQFSAGSVLHYVNGLKLEEEASFAQLPVRFSYGHNDAPYKKLWCREFPSLRT